MASIFDEVDKKAREDFGIFPRPEAWSGEASKPGVSYGPPIPSGSPLTRIGELGAGPIPTPKIPYTSPEQFRANVAVANPKTVEDIGWGYQENAAPGLPAREEVPWTSEATPGGGMRYTMQGDQGTLETIGWKPKEGGGGFSVLPGAGGPFGGIPKTAEQLELAARQAGTYQGRTLAEKEAAEWGPGGKPEAPGEFDYDKFNQGISKLGLSLTPQQKISLYGTALKEHENKTQQYNDLVKAQMQYGKGSAQMLSAQAEAESRKTASSIARAKLGTDIATSLANIDKTRAETAGIPASTEYTKAHTAYYNSLVENPEMKGAIAQLQAGMKMVEGEMVPDKRAALYNQVMSAFEAEKNRIYGRHSGRWEAARKINPDLPEKPVPGTVYELRKGQRFSVTPDGRMEPVR